MNNQSNHTRIGNGVVHRSGASASSTISVCGREVTLSPGSGLFINSHGQLDIDCSVLASKCKFNNLPVYGKQKCDITWNVTPTTVGDHGTVELNVQGLGPGQKVTLLSELVSGAADDFYNLQFEADAMGVIGYPYNSLQMPHKAGNYRMRLLVPGCSVSPIEQMVEVSDIAQQTACQGTVFIRPSFAVTSVGTGSQPVLTLTVFNTNTNNVRFRLDQISLPSGLTPVSGNISISPVVIQGNSSESYSFPVYAVNYTNTPQQVVVAIPQGKATYECDNAILPAGAETISLTIEQQPLPDCRLEIESFTFLPGSVVSGQAAQLKLVIKNSGASTLTNIGFLNGFKTFGGQGGATPINVNPNNAQLVLNNVTLQPGQTIAATVNFNSISASVAPGSSINYNASINAGEIVGQGCGASVTTQPAQASVIITGQ